MSDKANKLIKSSLLRTFSWALNIGVGFFMMPFLIHSLGERWYGFWILVTTFVGYYGFLDLGLATAVGRFVSRAIGKNDNEEVNRVVSTAFGVYSGVAVVSLLVTLAVYFAAPLIVKDPEEIRVFKYCIVLMGLTFSIGVVLRSFSGILAAHLRYDLVVYINLLKSVIRTTATVVCIKQGFGIESLATISLVMVFIEFALNVVIVKKAHPSLAIGRQYFVKSKIKEFFNYGGASFIAQLADNLRFKVDNLVISFFVGVNSIAVYAVAQSLSSYFQSLIISIVGMMGPVFSQYEGQDNYEAIRSKLLFSSKLSAILASSVGLAIILVGQLFIIRWMGEEYQNSYTLLIVLLVPICVALMQNPSVGLLYGISKHKFYAAANVVEGVFNLVLSLILVKNYGLLGVALGTAIPMLIIKIFVQPVYVAKIASINLFNYYRIFISAIIGVAGIQFTLRLLLDKFFVPSYINIFSLGALLASSSIAVVSFLILSKEEQSYFIVFAKGLFGGKPNN